MANGLEVRQSLTLNAPPDVLYDFWRRLSEFPRFMRHVESVEELDERRSHWVVRGPGDRRMEWDAEIVEDQPDDRIAWRSVPGSQVDNAGSVRFVPAAGNRGTEVHVELRYSPPGGVVGAAIAWLFGESPDQQVYDDLRALKQVMETGEIVVSEGTLGQRGYRQRPAQPPAQLPAGWSRQ